MAGTLSGGEQQMLAVGRALLSRPQLMMMDEPSLDWRRSSLKIFLISSGDQQQRYDDPFDRTEC